MEPLTAYLDTHVVVLLCTRPKRALGRRALRVIEIVSELRFSPAVLLELQLLREIGRLNAPPATFLESLDGALSLRDCTLPFVEVAKTALDLTWTRDPFDRLIVAQAMCAGAPLVTKDQVIHEHYAYAVWS